MRERGYAWVFVQASDAQDNVRLSCPLRNEMSTAARAEAPHLSRRRFECAKHILASRPAEVLSHYARRGRERRGVSLAARPAMTMHDRHVEAIDLVPNRAAKAAPFHHSIPLGVSGSATLSRLPLSIPNSGGFKYR
jgi:hypothetical protein